MQRLVFLCLLIFSNQLFAQGYLAKTQARMQCLEVVNLQFSEVTSSFINEVLGRGEHVDSKYDLLTKDERKKVMMTRYNYTVNAMKKYKGSEWELDLNVLEFIMIGLGRESFWGTLGFMKDLWGASVYDQISLIGVGFNHVFGDGEEEFKSLTEWYLRLYGSSHFQDTIFQSKQLKDLYDLCMENFESASVGQVNESELTKEPVLKLKMNSENSQFHTIQEG